jgi:tRNA isopentenyl-2-thiomethyl-A-37 hydroxylase MiaE
MAHVADHLSVGELEERYRTCTDACSARHYQTIWLLAQGHTIEETAETTCFVPRWIEELYRLRLIRSLLADVATSGRAC